MWGQQDIYWIAFYKFCENIRVKYKNESYELLDKWYELSRSCMWWYPFENYCIICNRPESIIWDETKTKLHSYYKPVVKFRDGWSIYAIDGISVDERLINNPKSVTIEEIEKEENAELKRIKIQVYDKYRQVGAFIIDSGAVCIHKDIYGELFKKEIKDDESLVMVKVINSTINQDGRRNEYFLRVPPNMKRAKQAVAWTFGIDEDKYNPIVET